MSEWHERYNKSGLVIIANHFPEFTYEHDLDNLKKAIDDQHIAYIVTQDNLGINWKAYNNHYWPTLYLIDKSGDVRYKHIGEGAYKETEAAIKELLAESYP